ITDFHSRDYTIRLDFLDSGVYTAEIYADAPDSGANPKKVAISKRKVRAGEKFTVRLAEAGGMTVVFKRIKN
ncbi:MAG: glycoside hydrolase family 97 C-terminal domain-containing protein, partial [Bacteroidales bacterium]|nr:glycoside hydrolase family 97 C-terminal domain-containing protein [Bacteroidales bacterium]